MLPPALGGLRFRVPPVPGHPAPRSMSKIMFQGDCPRGTPQLYQKYVHCGGENFGDCAARFLPGKALLQFFNYRLPDFFKRLVDIE